MITHNIPLFCGKAKYDPHKASRSGLEVIKLEYRLGLKMRNDWLLADTCPQAANLCALF